jgi:hypothetical protein
MMDAINRKAGAGCTAPASHSADVATPAAISYPERSGAANAKAAGQPRKRRERGEPAIAFKGPLGRFVVTGQTARALVALVKAGKAGVTALEVNSWAYRLGAYVHRLRHENGLAIETVREPHDGGWHGRYVLRCPVVLEAGQ